MMSRFQKQHLRLGRLRLQPERHHPGLQRALPLPGEPAQRLALLPEPPAQLPGDLQRHPSKVPVLSLAANPASLQCGTLDEGSPGGNLTERSLQDAQRFFLMSDVVQPVTVNPLLAQDNLRFSRMVVDVVQGRGARYHVMYIATGETLIVAATELPPTRLE